MEEHQVAEILIQDGGPEELDERKFWKERLRKEILEEEKERIMNFVESEVARKKAEIEKLLEISGKPAKLVFLPKDATHILEKLNLELEQDSSLSHQLVSASIGIFLAPATQDVDIEGDSKLAPSSGNSGTKGESILDVGSKGDPELRLSLDDSDTKGGSTPDVDIKGDSELGLSLDDFGTKGEPTLDSGRKGDSETLEAHIKGESKLGFCLDDSGNKGEPIPVEEAKAEEEESEEKQLVRPRKKQKTTGCKWSCPLCGVTATSEINLNNHFMGKKHKMESLKAQQAMKIDPENADEGNEMPTNRLPMKIQANGKLFVVYKKGSKLWCSNSNCKFMCTESAEMILHLIGTEHVEVREKIENGPEDRNNS